MYQKQQLQQQRHISNQFDIASGEPLHQEIAGQPCKADREADRGGEQYTKAGNQQGIEKTDPKRVAIR